MTLCEVVETRWLGGPATLKTHDGRYELHIDEYGDLTQQGAWRIPAHVLCGNEWELEYPIDFSTEEVLKALNRLSSDMQELNKPEWNDWCYQRAKLMIYAVARALNFKIEKMRKV